MYNNSYSILKYEKHLVITFFLFSLILHLLYAMYCVGYYHPDEHFQILEFATIKLPFSSGLSLNLPWEYHDHIRSTLQPYMVILLAKSLFLIGVYTPFNAVIVLQLFSAVFGSLVNFMLFIEVKKYFKDWRIRLLLFYLLMFHYFFPLIHSRFSSESISGSVFITGVIMLLKLEQKVGLKKTIFCLVLGCVFGISFLLRFQIAFSLFGIAIWLMLFTKISINNTILIFFGFLTAVISGVVLDRFYYGEWVFTPWEYFKLNIIHDKASGFGVMPVWGYFQLLYSYLISPYSLFFIAGCFFSSVKFSRSIFVLAFIPFFIAHSLVAHKEMRFMFPLLSFLPVLLCLALESVKIKEKYNWLLVVVMIGFIFMNSSIQLTLLRPLNPNIGLYKYIYNNYNDFESKEEINLLTLKSNPYKLGSLKINFYKPINLKISEVPLDSVMFSLYPENRHKVLVLSSDNQTLKDTPGFEFNLKYRDEKWLLYELNELKL